MPRILHPIVIFFVFIFTPSYVSAYLKTTRTPAGRPQRQTSSHKQRYYQIHPMYDETKCLDVRQSGYADGTPVDMYVFRSQRIPLRHLAMGDILKLRWARIYSFECNGTPAQNWVLQPGTTRVKVAGKNFCLDAGIAPTNGTKLKIWTCYPNLPAQTWYYTDDKRISLKEGGLCMDLTDGSSENYNAVQVWKCANGNTNQIWTV